MQMYNVRNLCEDYYSYKFMVVRVEEMENGEKKYWYYAVCNSVTDAFKMAVDIENGIVIETTHVVNPKKDAYNSMSEYLKEFAKKMHSDGVSNGEKLEYRFKVEFEDAEHQFINNIYIGVDSNAKGYFVEFDTKSGELPKWIRKEWLTPKTNVHDLYLLSMAYAEKLNEFFKES